MQFVGSFEIKRFKDLHNKRGYIERATRDALYTLFCYAIGEMLLEIARQIPYLTGATRGAVVGLLEQLDARIQMYGGGRQFARKVRMSTTLRKKFVGEYPTYSNNLAAIQYTRTYRRHIRIYNRADWKDYLETYEGQSPTSERQNATASFFGMGTTSWGKMIYRFRLDIDHWQIWDEEGRPTKGRMYGPWHVIRDGVKAFDAAIERNKYDVENLIMRPFRDFSTSVAEAIADLENWEPEFERY